MHMALLLHLGGEGRKEDAKEGIWLNILNVVYTCISACVYTHVCKHVYLWMYG